MAFIARAGNGLEVGTEGPGDTGAGSSSPPEAREDRTNARVTRVVDGDTIEVHFRQRNVTVRLIGINTPESMMPGEPVQCYGLAASRFTTARARR